MATRNGTATAAKIAGTKTSTYQWGGLMRVSHDSYTMTAALTAGEIVRLGHIPFGARILGGDFSNSTATTGCTFTLGLIGVDGSSDSSAAMFCSANNLMTDSKTLRWPTAGNGDYTPYRVTDDEGAYVICTIVAGGVSTAGGLLALANRTEWVID